MAEFIVPVHRYPDLSVFSESYYDEFNIRRQGSYYSAQRITEELTRFCQSWMGGERRPVRILDVGGAEGDVLCKALENVPDLEVDAVTVVDPIERYLDLYSKNITALNSVNGRKITFKPIVDTYGLEKLKKFHNDHGMECRYDIVLLINTIYLTGLVSVPEIRDNFLKPESGLFVVICTHQSPVAVSQKFARAHYERFYPGMNPSKPGGNGAEDLMHFAVHDNSCFMKSYHELFEVTDIVKGDDRASGNEKGRCFLRYPMQRDLDPLTPAGDLELRIYVTWVKNEAVPYPYLDLKTGNESLGPVADNSSTTYLLVSQTSIYRLTSESLIDTLTVNTAMEATDRWNQKTTW